MRLKPSIRASVSGSSTAGSAVSSYDPMAHSPNRGTTPLKDETAEPGDTITPEEITKDRFLLREQEYGPGTNLRRRIAAD